MARYVLKDDGYAFKKICSGRKWIGRVWKNIEGTYTGKIGKTERSGASEHAAFDAVVSAHLGYGSVEDLNAHNSVVRAANRRRKSEVDAMARRMLGGDFDALLDLMKDVK